MSDIQNFLKKLSLTKTTGLIGLDIGTSSIKMVELEKVGKNYRVLGYASAAVEKDAIRDGQISNPVSVSNSIKKAYNILGSKTKRVALALPVSMSIYKKILVPTPSDYKNFDFVIEGEAVNHIPFPLEDIFLDYFVLGNSPNSLDTLEVLICASRKDKVNERIDVLKMAGLEAQVMDVDLFASMAAFEEIKAKMPEQGFNQTFAIFDIGVNKTQCFISRNGQELYQQTLLIGGGQLTRDIQRFYGYSTSEAEEAKLTMSLPENYEMEVLNPYMNNLAQEMQRTLQFFYATGDISQHLRVDSIVLIGGGSKLIGLDDVVTERTQIGVLVANMFLNMTLNSKHVDRRSLDNNAASLFLAGGLALRKFDE
jgi:type IV pilus assembly protein PilM